MSTSDPDSRLLLVMRHGKAESNAARIDRERRLTDRGRSQAQLVAEYLRSQGVKLARVLVSDAARTRETLEHVAAQMPGLDAEVTFHEEIYAGGPSEVLELLHGSEDRQDRTSTRLNSSHVASSYAVSCSKKRSHQRDGT